VHLGVHVSQHRNQRIADPPLRRGDNETFEIQRLLDCAAPCPRHHHTFQHGYICAAQKGRRERGDDAAPETCDVVGLGSKTAIFPSIGAARINAANLALRYDYQIHLKQVAGFAETTILAALRHIAKFEEFADYAEYKSTLRDAVIRFKENLEARPSANGGAQLSASTIVHALLDLKAFFSWMSQRSGQKSISPDIAALFTPSKAMMSLATTCDERFIPSLDEVRQLIQAMPSASFVEGRDRAIIAFRAIIRTLPMLQHDPHNIEDLDTEGEDHAADSARYAVMSRPYVARTPDPNERSPWLVANAFRLHELGD